MLRLVALNSLGKIAGCEEWRVGLDHKSVRWYFSNKFSQVLAAAFVADPTGDSNVEIEVQVGVQFALGSGEAMDDTANQPAAMRLENFDKVAVGVAFVKKDRHFQISGQGQLRFKALDLNLPWGEVAVEVESAFADGDDWGLPGQLPQGCDSSEIGIRLEFARVVGMNTGCRVENTGFFRRQRRCSTACIGRSTGNDQFLLWWRRKQNTGEPWSESVRHGNANSWQCGTGEGTRGELPIAIDQKSVKTSKRKQSTGGAQH